MKSQFVVKSRCVKSRFYCKRSRTLWIHDNHQQEQHQSKHTEITKHGANGKKNSSFLGAHERYTPEYFGKHGSCLSYCIKYSRFSLIIHLYKQINRETTVLKKKKMPIMHPTQPHFIIPVPDTVLIIAFPKRL